MYIRLLQASYITPHASHIRNIKVTSFKINSFHRGVYTIDTLHTTRAINVPINDFGNHAFNYTELMSPSSAKVLSSSLQLPLAHLFLTRLLLGMLLKRMGRVGAQRTLGVIGILLRVSLLRCTTLVVDVGRRGAGLRVGLVLRLGGLATCVGGRHDDDSRYTLDGCVGQEEDEEGWWRTVWCGWGSLVHVSLSLPSIVHLATLTVVLFDSLKFVFEVFECR
jgi:hypothetical protein